jgi:hypothetical protein
VGLLFEPRDESACPCQGHAEIINTEKQKETVAGRRVIGAHQGGMLVGAPLVEAKQDSSIRVEDLPKVGMGWRRLRLADRPDAFIIVIVHRLPEDCTLRAPMR